MFDNIIFGRKFSFDAYMLVLFFSWKFFLLRRTENMSERVKLECEKHAGVYYITREKHFQVSHNWS